MNSTLRTLWTRTAETARLMIGVPDYDAYVAHLRQVHPDTTPMTREEFFRAAQQSRYGGRVGRCC
jgi:uncharacterized short protein YbdD (DUF466 family)